MLVGVSACSSRAQSAVEARLCLLPLKRQCPQEDETLQVHYPLVLSQVKNKTAANVQITAEQLIREAQERRLEEVPPVCAFVFAQHRLVPNHTAVNTHTLTHPLTQ